MFHSNYETILQTKTNTSITSKNLIQVITEEPESIKQPTQSTPKARNLHLFHKALQNPPKTQTLIASKRKKRFITPSKTPARAENIIAPTFRGFQTPRDNRRLSNFRTNSIIGDKSRRSCRKVKETRIDRKGSK